MKSVIYKYNLLYLVAWVGFLVFFVLNNSFLFIACTTFGYKSLRITETGLAKHLIILVWLLLLLHGVHVAPFRKLYSKVPWKLGFLSKKVNNDG